MPGLLSAKEAPEAMPETEPMPSREGAGEPGESSNVTPEEQAAYDGFVDRGLSLIFDPKAAPVILERIKKAPNPVEGLAATAVMVVTRLKDSAAKAGQDIDPSILLHGGAELLENVALLSKASGVHTYSPEEIEQATYSAMDRYGNQEMERGGIDKEGIARDFQEMMAADKEGRIDEVIPGMSEKAQSLGGK